MKTIFRQIDRETCRKGDKEIREIDKDTGGRTDGANNQLQHRCKTHSLSLLVFLSPFLLGFLSPLIAPKARAEALWVEGEDAVKTTFNKHGWYRDVQKDLLSGKDWLVHFGPKPAEAVYKIKVADAADYTFWVRCNYFQVTQHYKIDSGDWVPCDFSAPREEVMVSAKIDIRFLGWFKLGKVALTPGEHTVTFRVSSKNNNHGGIDCFVFITNPWVPAGIHQPGEARPAGPADWFEVNADDDPFSEKSITDLSGLLPKPAGKFGFVTRDGRHLVLDGKPVKFWGCGANLPSDKPREWQEQWIHWLAKNGINMVRQHTVEGQLGQLLNNPQTGEREFDKERLDQWDWWCATLKKHGIYMTWSMFYPHLITSEDGYDLFAELLAVNKDSTLRSASGLVNVEPGLQEAEWVYVQKLLLHRNPYTGLRYIDDPALAVLETHNEDCIFFFDPLDRLVEGKQFPRHTARLQQRWAEWLKDHYGSDEKLKEVWGPGIRPGDSLDNPAMGLYHAWEMATDGPSMQGPGKPERKRMGDFIHFLADTQRGYYQRRQKQLHDLGFRAVTVSTAWRAGGPAADPANLWCDDAMDLIDRHNYFGGGEGGHGIKEGKVNNDSQLAQPGSGLLSTGLYQVKDKPFSMTEWTDCPPNQWKAEAAPLLAFYGMGLQGWDASYHFLSSRKHLGEGWPSMSAYVTDTPHYMSQFPALAFALYQGHIKEAPIAAARRLKPDQLFLGIDPLQQDFTGGGYDAKAIKGSLATPVEVLAIGRVVSEFGDKVGPSEKVDWSQYWDKGKKTVASMTGELTWDYGRRIVTLATPKTQAVIGFAGGTTKELPGVTVQVKTPFVSLIFTPLDNMPLAESRHILITAMARDQQTGTEYNKNGSILIKAGGPPLLLEPVQATITLKGAAPQEVNVVDIYGVPTDKKVPTMGNRFTIDGHFQTIYYEVKR